MRHLGKPLAKSPENVHSNHRDFSEGRTGDCEEKNLLGGRELPGTSPNESPGMAQCLT